MRTIFILFIFLISSFEISAQKGTLKYEVDTVIFNKRVGDNFISDSLSAKVLCIKLPFSYDEALVGFRDESNKNIIKINQDEYKNGNKRIFYKKGKLLEGEIEFLVEVYLIEMDDKTTIVMSGIYASKYESLLREKIEIAAKSVRIE